MRIAYIIGNGFDLGLGLKTSYNDFIDWYLATSAAKLDSVNKMRQKIATHKESWGDAEMAFACLPFSTFGDDPVTSYMECFCDIRFRLGEYLRLQESKISYPKDAIALSDMKKQFADYLFDVFEYDEAGEIRYWMPWGDSKNTNVDIDVISLNYTSTIEKLLPKSIVYHDKIGKGHHRIRFSNVMHLHGEAAVGGQEMVFGVSYPRQIKDFALKKRADDVGSLLKPRYFEGQSCDPYLKLQNCLRNSDIIVLYGLSCGPSDAYLVHSIIENVLNNRCSRIYHSAFDDNIANLRDLSIVQYQEDSEIMFCDHLVSYGEMPGMRDDLVDCLFTYGVGPFAYPDGQKACFDPFRLRYFGKILGIR